jgi:hypothetical protein
LGEHSRRRIKHLFLLVGDYLPLTEMHTPAPCWKQTKARSVMFMKNTLARLQATEQHEPTRDQTHVNKFIDLSILLFVDFQSTPKRDARLAESSSILRKHANGRRLSCLWLPS